MLAAVCKMDQCHDISSTSDPSDNGGGIEDSCVGVVELASVKTEKSVPEKVKLSVKTPTTPKKANPVSRLSDDGKKLLICGIPNCGQKAEQLKFAPSHALTYYGLKNKLTIVKVCQNCLDKAEKFERDSINFLRNGKCMFTAKHEPQCDPTTVDLSDEDDNDTDVISNATEEVEVDFDRGDVENLVKNIIAKFDIEKQMESCTQKLMEEASELGNEFCQLNEQYDQIEDVLIASFKQYQKAFDTRPTPLIVQELDIRDDGSIRKRNLPNLGIDSAVFVNRESRKKIIKKAIIKTETSSIPEQSDAGAEFDALYCTVTNTADSRKPGPASKTGYYDALDALKGPFQPKVKRPAGLEPTFDLLPTPNFIPRVQPADGDIVYAMNKNNLNFWLQAEILETLENEDTKKPELVIHFEPTRKGRPVQPRGVQVEGDGSIRMMRQVTLRELAYNIPCPFILPVGTRVIAKFRDELNMDPETDGQYYAGIVAEPPKSSINNNRYLIFFDDGYAQYVTSDGILLICDNSQPVWNDIYAESHDFIKDYINKYPSWPMVRMSINSMVSTEWNGRWLIARVKEVDCAMAKLRFENDGREEWIYRGSPRLRPIYRCTENKETNKSTRPRHDTAAYKNRNEPTVEYNKHHINTDKKSARKSTGGLNNRNMLGGSSKGHINMEDPDVNIEYQGTMEKIKIPDNVPKPKEYVPHACSPECEIDNKPSQDLKKLSPLMIPLFLGWSREVSRSPRHNIAYRAPCGVSLRDYDELNVYMEKINSSLSVDYFCFDYTVDCLAEFKPTRDLQCIRDISYGKEKKPISCVNSVDYDPLPFMEYTPYRIVGDGVSINTSDDFLACCDCTDNCLDKTKCACWKLTEEGIAFDDRLQDENGIPIIGYQNRRLKEHIISGIYECNSKCRCKSTCLNRVVQNGVSFPLQVFKTSKKGWGIRAMHDMPDGSFICIYSGRVLTDHSANEGGKEYGDEYLAELDFIEINEKVKEDYESDVSDIEANDSMNDEERAENRSQTNDENMESEPEMDSHAGDSSFVANVKVPDQTRSVPIRRTNGQKRNLEADLLDFHRDEDSITARTVNRFNPQISPRKKKKRPSARTFFGTDESVYIMDAKSTGNLGRYLNHSCMPNVFVQNVFVDTHDIRFPLVAFFTNKYIRAGTELTWDYHYEINSVSGRTLYCFCGTPYCRNRLL